MWFEIIPSAAIITVAMSVPYFGLYGLHKLTLGTAYRRTLEDRFQRNCYTRDRRLNDNPYKITGLESIPDLKD